MQEQLSSHGTAAYTATDGGYADIAGANICPYIHVHSPLLAIPGSLCHIPPRMAGMQILHRYMDVTY